MGMSVKTPPPPPPPPAPRDEADAVDTAFLMKQRALGQFGYKKTFLSGLRGPEGASLGTTQAAMIAADGGNPNAGTSSAPTRGTPPVDPSTREYPSGGNVQPAPPRTTPTTTTAPRNPRSPPTTPRRGGHG